MALIPPASLFRPSDRATCTNGHFEGLRVFAFTPLSLPLFLPLAPLPKRTLDVKKKGQLDTLRPKKEKKRKKSEPVFIIRNMCVVIPRAVIALSTRKPDFQPAPPPCFFSAGLAGYLLLLPQRLNRGERAFCRGLEPFALQIRALVQG